MKPQETPFAWHGSAQTSPDPRSRHAPEQHSALPVQAVAFALQVGPVGAQARGVPVQLLVQQSPLTAHGAPFALHGAAHWFEALQTPEQQVPGAAGQVPLFGVHATAVQTWVLGSQAPDAQSVPVAQDRPVAHFVGQDPPQSTSVSVPFLKPSLQVGLAQRWVTGLQKPEVQSAAAAQPWPTAQVFPWARHVAPPQSTAVSAPFLSPSVQLGVAQRCVVGLQNPEAQSCGTPQPTPSAQVRAGTRARHVAPPQSTPVSEPFFTPSVHVGAGGGGGEPDDDDDPEQPPQQSAAASARTESVGRVARDMSFSPR